jgi:nucleotide-binding universal stress UspA family protein
LLYNLFQDSHSSLPHNQGAGKTEILAALCSRIANNHGIHPVLLNEQGNVVDTIIRIAVAQQADLIVMGTHGTSGSRDGFMGTTTYSVMKQAPLPVLSIPNGKKQVNFRNILFPIRPTKGALQLYSVVSHFLGKQPSLNVLGLSNQKVESEFGVLQTILSEIEAALQEDGTQTRAFWSTGNNIADGVLACTHQTGADLLVITSQLDVASKPCFIGPYSQKIVNTSKVPVLFLKKVEVPMLA